MGGEKSSIVGLSGGEVHKVIKLSEVLESYSQQQFIFFLTYELTK
jgi:hypothetical protein